MAFVTPHNFIFIPDPQLLSGILYELQPSEQFKPGSFVLIPYSNPQVKNPRVRFYKVMRQIPVKDISALAPHPNGSALCLKAMQSKQQYLERVRGLKQHIQLGNIYEINYCIRFAAEGVAINPYKVFAVLHRLAKAPYDALVKLGNEYILSASPELFLQKKGVELFTKPIKGTIRRGKNQAEDDALKKSLYESKKERMENVMAVDVARNDLSQFAKRASVKVNKLYNIETFETVHQMVSTISCEPKDDTTFGKIIDSTFPMASMTGAPKLMAMKLIDEYEGFERGVYSGTMGLVDKQGDFILSVIIRSIFYDERAQQVFIAVGSAITNLSDPEQEYEECLLKAEALLKALDARVQNA